MLPSWIRSRNCKPRFVYFFAIEMTNLKLASTISFLAWAAFCWPCLITAITRLSSSARALARVSAALISCWATQICCCLSVGNFLAAFRCRSLAAPLVVPLGTGSRKDTYRRFWRSSRSEEHTSELQSRQYLVCRLLLEKKKAKRRSDLGAREAEL